MIKGIVKNCHVEGQTTDSRHDRSGEEAISIDHCQVCIFNRKQTYSASSLI